MTRETKIGLVVASSFLCLVGVVVASKFNQSKTQAEDAALKVKKDLSSEIPQPIPLVSGAPGIFDPKVEKVASTLPNQGDNRPLLPSIPSIPNETPPPGSPSFPRIDSPPGFPEVKPPTPASFPPVAEVKPQIPVSFPPVAEVKPPVQFPPVESPGLPFTSVEDDKLKKAMEQLKNESTKPRIDVGGALAQADPVPPPVSPPPTSTPPIPAIPGTPPSPPSPGSSSTPTTPMLPGAPPVIPTPPGTTPTSPTLPSPVIPSIPPTPPGGASTPTLPSSPVTPAIPPTQPGGNSTPPTLPGNPLVPVTPTTPTLPTPIPSSPTAPVFTPPQDLTKPPVENPLTRSPQDPNLPSPFAKPENKPVTAPPFDNNPRGSASPVISELPSDKKPPFIGTLADPNKTAPIITSQPDTLNANGTKDYWQFQDSWEKVSTRFFQTPRYAKALEAFNQRADVRPGDTILVPSSGFLDQRFAQFVSNTTQPILQPGISPVAPPMGITPVAPPMGISPITPPPGITSNPGVDLTAPRSPIASGAGTTSNYRVPSGGKFITEVARETLRSEFEWSRIFELNRHLLLNPSQRIPEGTILTIPQPKS